MKTLYIVRHAKSSWDDPFLDDFDRPLNKRGRADAPRMGKRLQERDVHPDLLISSPAERALSTCMIIAEKIGYPARNIHTDRRLYHASPEQLLSVLRGVSDGNDEIMIFGHNPGLTDFANELSRERVTSNIPTGGVVCLTFNVLSWKDIAWGKGEIEFYDFPKNKQ